MRSSPKKEPPTPEVPTCKICGTAIPLGQAEAAGPVCEEHDTEIARERVRLEHEIGRAQEGIAHAQMTLVQYEGPNRQWDENAKRAERQRRTWSDKLKRARDALQDLRERCDHEQMEEHRREYTEEDLAMVPPEEMPEQVPITEVHRSCWECGFEETTTDADD